MSSNTASSPDWSAVSAMSSEWSRALAGAMRGASQAWSQPILPGWTFNINSNNSAAPQTEVEVLQQYSYGRQLGRISDALEALIEQLVPEAQQKKAPYEPFMSMTKRITEMKSDAAVARIDQLRADLLLLKATHRDDYERIRQSLRRTLEL
jgi:hypothetical protein